MYKKKVMSIANDIVNNNPVLRSDATATAHTIAKFVKVLRENKIVKFRFLKKDGSIRTAIGTNHHDIISDKIKGTSTAKKRNDVQPYHDLEKNAFRSFKVINLIDFEIINLEA